jgi:hypothetical protein
MNIPKGYLAPWEKLGERSYIRRMSEPRIPYGKNDYYVWFAPNAKTWRMEGYDTEYIFMIDYQTAEEAMAAMDERLKKIGWKLLNEKTVLLI